jgi:phage gp36-like protein
LAYATLADLIARYGDRELVQLTDRADPPAGLIDPDVAAKALTDASAMIDSYLGQAYTLPLATTPSVLVETCQSIARYKLHPGEATDRVRTDYTDALKWLGQIAKGQASLPGIEPTKVEGGSGAILTSSGDRLFSRETLRGF